MENLLVAVIILNVIIKNLINKINHFNVIKLWKLCILDKFLGFMNLVIFTKMR